MKDTTNFEDIRPFTPEEYHEKAEGLLNEPMFRKVITTVMPGVDYEQLSQLVLSLQSVDDFQAHIILPWLRDLIKNNSSGLTCQGIEELDTTQNYLFMSNHRDIVLDSALLCYSLILSGRQSCEIAIGSNLLIYDWISDFVRLNKSFIVKRGIGIRQALSAAQQLSAYIDNAINKKGTSIWIAQREGRSKDSHDRTQEALLKMLTLSGDGAFIEKICRLNITPVSISYEYDPCDYLKAAEFLQKSKDPNYKKSPQDDLINMQTGIFGKKGGINIHVAPCINNEIIRITDNDKAAQLSAVAQLIDHHIHLNYRIYPGNYIAYDIYYKTDMFASKYTSDEKNTFEQYIAGQISKIGELSQEDHAFVYNKLMLMYSNILKNQLEAQQREHI